MLDSKFKGLSDIALKEAKTAGCSYADIRFTRATNNGVNASGGNPVPGEIRTTFGGFGGGGGRGGGRGGGGFGGGGGGGRGGGRRGGGGTGVGAAGFGVRVIHSGIWGFASSPIVTEDEIRRITQDRDGSRPASAIAKKTDVKLAPVPAVPGLLGDDRREGSRRRSRARPSRTSCRRSSTRSSRTRTSRTSTSRCSSSYEWKYFASSEGSYIEQESWFTNPSFTVTARKDDVVRTRTFSAVPKGGGWEVAEDAKMLENAERIAAEAVEFTHRASRSTWASRTSS